MASRSSKALEVSSTRNAVFFAELIEDLLRWAGAAGGNVFESLADAFAGIGLGGEVEQALIFGGILEDGFGLAVDGEDDGALGLLELLDELDGVVAEGGEWLDVLGDVEVSWHGGGLRYRYFIVPLRIMVWKIRPIVVI